jgi:hypothetical protein
MTKRNQRDTTLGERRRDDPGIGPPGPAHRSPRGRQHPRHRLPLGTDAQGSMRQVRSAAEAGRSRHRVSRCPRPQRGSGARAAPAH